MSYFTAKKCSLRYTGVYGKAPNVSLKFNQKLYSFKKI